MKSFWFIGAFFVLLLLGCNHPSVETQCIASLQRLSAIDSVMWQQPDSAFSLLLAFAESPEADSLDEFNGHYFQLLVSELLYKNGYEQSNRDDLLKAVAYFDKRDNAFLDARAHYINGVGFYERDSVVEACEEYLKALEIMETCFDNKEQIRGKARFLAYSYNRLGDLFSEQFMIESSIACYVESLLNCMIEPTSPTGLSTTLSRIGQLYEMKGESGKAKEYYRQALDKMPNSDDVNYRDLMALIALCDYRTGKGMEQALDVLKQVTLQTNDGGEVLVRYLTIGDIYFEEGLYDSALLYLEPVYALSKDTISKIKAAEFLCTIYDNVKAIGKKDECVRFLGEHKKSEGENKVLVSKLDDLYNTYLSQKQARAAETERKASIRKTIAISVPLALLIALAIIVMAYLRSKKQRKENESLQQGLQQREKLVDVLERALNQRREKDENRHENFLNEAVCQHILDLVHGLHITSRDTPYQHGISLDHGDYKQLRDAVEKHYEGFDCVLLGRCASLKQSDLALCHLYLLGLNESEIAALKGRTYSAVIKQNEKLQEILGIEETVAEYVLKVVEKLYRTPNSLGDVPQGVPQEISQIIFEIVSSNPKVTREEIANQLGISTKTVGRYMKKLGGRIRFVGSGYSGHWEVIN